MGAGPGYGDRAHPKYWDRVASIFPNLKINLAHFFLGWGEEILDLMIKHENIYSDISYSSMILREEDHDDFASDIKWFIDKNPVIKDRIMYGTDWVMLSVESNHEMYLRYSEKIYSQAVNENQDDVHKFFYKNACDFFWFAKSNVNTRLKKYYDRVGIKYPEFLL